MRSLTISERIAAAANRLPVAVYDAFPAVLFGRVLTTASKAGLFDLLVPRPLSAKEVGLALRLKPRAAELILRSLEANGYLRHSRGTYTLTPRSRKWIVSTSPHYIGNFLAYLDLLSGHWQSIETSLKSGREIPPFTDRFTAPEWRVYTLGMRDLATLVLPELFRVLRFGRSTTRLLDIGGSHGLYSIEACRRIPALSATVADASQVLAVTKELVEEAGMASRLTLRPCDIATADFGAEENDAVFLFNIIHGFDEQTNRSILHSAAQSLRRGGRIFILDEFLPDGTSGARSLLPLMVGINLINETGGTVYSRGEVEEWCRGEGLAGIGSRRLRIPGIHLLTAGAEQ